ncbi:MAG TPA: hypothetical protein VFP21_05585 [Solirubrobacterales bacterium]|nr:hypothetical protein [Solirubrobacterales bacterium]
MSDDPAGAAVLEEILAWEDDPGEPQVTNKPAQHPRPDLGQTPFPSEIVGDQASPGELGSPGFRYWAAADSLRRAADFWGGICGDDAPWNENVGAQLPVDLDHGEDFNAYYDREGLKFFHGAVDGQTFYSGESPDVVCHEFGHAVLDSVQPQLWSVHTAEPPALHEAFGDMSAMLSSLQLESFRKEVLSSTSGRIDSSSRLSRLAEQLGWAIRQSYPQAVDPDCLRNASNYFFYRDPLTLPPSAPASSLSSEPHSFSRVFSGSFLSALAGMFLAGGDDGDSALQQVAQDAGQLLIDAARNAPVVVSYFSQFAAHMIDADQQRFNGRYGEALRHGFTRHGVLSLPDASSPLAASAPSPPLGMTGTPTRPPTSVQAPMQKVALAGQAFGLDEHLLVHAPAASKRFNVAAAALDTGAVTEPTAEAAAAGYVEDIFRRGHVAIPEKLRGGCPVYARSPHASHEVRRVDDNLVLVRLHFKCGWDVGGE